MNHNYTEKEIKDIQERTDKVNAFIKEQELGIAVQVVAANNGNDTFSFKPIPYLQDFKFKKDETTTEA